MKITEVNKKVIPETYQVRYYFSGYITPEEMQDIIHSSFSTSHAQFITTQSIMQSFFV